MERPEPKEEVAAADRSQVESPTGDGSVSVKSRASTAKRSGKLRSRQAPSTGLQPTTGSSTTSLAASDHTASKKDLSTERGRRRRSSVTSARSSPEGTGESRSLNEQLLAKKAASVKLSRQLKAIVCNIYGCGELSSTSHYYNITLALFVKFPTM